MQTVFTLKALRLEQTTKVAIMYSNTFITLTLENFPETALGLPFIAHGEFKLSSCLSLPRLVYQVYHKAYHVKVFLTPLTDNTHFHLLATQPDLLKTPGLLHDH